jgi:hypothetical protein
LRSALAASPAPPEHPDAGLLTAYAENALGVRERRQLLDHLTLCAGCRQVLALAQDAAPAPEPAPASVRWWRLRVLAPTLVAAAAVIVVSVVVVERQSDRSARREAAAPVAQQFAPVPAQPAPKATENKMLARKVAPDQAGSGGLMAPAANRSEAAPPPVDAFANAVTADALERAPASKSLARPHWRINSKGEPERAFGNGPWLPAMSSVPARMLVVSVSGSQVWVGGEKTQLFRSMDNGATWIAVPLPQKGGPEHAIAHIRFVATGEVRIEAADGTMWSSSDGGNTWN